MAAGSNGLPANQPSARQDVHTEVERVHQERTPPSQPVRIYTTDIFSRQSLLLTSGFGAWASAMLHAFNVFDTSGDQGVLLRRVCMVGILFIQTVYRIIGVWEIRHEQFPLFILFGVAATAGFFISINWLALIGEMSGKRRVFGKVIGRKDFDGYLAVMFVLEFVNFTGVLRLSIFDLGFGSFILQYWAARISRTPNVEEECTV